MEWQVTNSNEGTHSIGSDFMINWGTTRLPQTSPYISNTHLFGSKNLWNTSNIKYWHFLEAKHTLKKWKKVSSHKQQSNQPQLKKYTCTQLHRANTTAEVREADAKPCGLNLISQNCQKPKTTALKWEIKKAWNAKLRDYHVRQSNIICMADRTNEHNKTTHHLLLAANCCCWGPLRGILTSPRNTSSAIPGESCHSATLSSLKSTSCSCCKL